MLGELGVLWSQKKAFVGNRDCKKLVDFKWDVGKTIKKKTRGGWKSSFGSRIKTSYVHFVKQRHGPKCMGCLYFMQIDEKVGCSRSNL